MTAAPVLPAAPKVRRRWIGWAIAGGVLLVLIVVGLFVGEAAARAYATERIHDELVTAFELDADHPTDIDLGGGSLLLQAASGTVDGVDVAIDDVPLGDLTGDITLAATGVPIDTTQPAETIAATATLDEDDVASLRDYLSGIQLDSITLGDGVIDVSATVRALFLTVPVSAAIEPTAQDGQLVFSPESVTVNGSVVSVDQLLAGPLANVASGFLGAQTFCVAQYLPAAITLDGVSVSTDELELSFSGENVALGGADLSTKGTCG
ncbi:hypothetical protein GCM10027413_23210 [Conyzicola nivalis]|uniref:DUF2993 domain-containing protein n=1 Tax=Conyzicola nivalis TaxID=1477021 RepID=A0A916SB93_9MICO|nr:DUF2993 domain-containing protein [Conyzicola nivalis]GGA92047.1 hypothetical protein GCM10010979_03410 [Conyzicola nivalis]